MGWKCCVPNCRSGYKSESDNSSGKISFFSFPTDPNLRAQWIKAIPRDFEPTPNSRVCCLHFYPSDFVKTTQDTNATRKRRRSISSNEVLQRLHLKPTAFPQIFPNCPSYFTTAHSSPRKSSASSSSRHLNEEARISRMEEELELSEAIQSFEDLLHHLPTLYSPNGFVSSRSTDSVTFLCVESMHSIDLPPRLTCSVRINRNLHPEVYIHKTRVSPSIFSHVLKTADIISSLQKYQIYYRS